MIEDHRPRAYFNKSDYIKIRTSVIKKMKQLSNIFQLQKKTFFLSVEYLDKICSSMYSFNSVALEQISQYCILLAAKYQENRIKAKEIENKFKDFMPNNFNQDELYLLKLLDYDLNLFTAYDILMDVIYCGFLFEDEKVSIKKMNVVYNKIENILYLFSESKFYIDMTPKQIVIAIIGLVRESLNLEAYNGLFKTIFFFNDKLEEEYYLICLNKVKKCIKIKPDSKKEVNLEKNCIKKENGNDNISNGKIFDLEHQQILQCNPTSNDKEIHV